MSNSDGQRMSNLNVTKKRVMLILGSVSFVLLMWVGISMICGENRGEENGHLWVDLGLPSGIKWATCNVGAEVPADYGNYYAWGEVIPKAEYRKATYKYGDPNRIRHNLTKYCTHACYGANDFSDKSITLVPEDDAAHINWGGNWRIPTATEWDELINYCTWTWTTRYGVSGYQVTSKVTNSSIFLPAAGARDDEEFDPHIFDGSGAYGSSSLYENYPYCVWGIRFFPGWVDWNKDDRYYGRSIRPVCP